ncbi:unnamed protein product [Linum trigynum]|uniref:Uncharacterized protein n=1 Tax=Linum trigynum TaxID=586398 RepID=A0AAV2GNW1_9ROSI
MKDSSMEEGDKHVQRNQYKLRGKSQPPDVSRVSLAAKNHRTLQPKIRRKQIWILHPSSINPYPIVHLTIFFLIAHKLQRFP